MNKLIVPVALAMFSVSMASAALADQPGNPGQGFENSLNPNACLNSGAGNGGENFELRGGRCGSAAVEACTGLVCPIIPDRDPGNSAKHNNAPPEPPGQAKKD